MTSRFKLACMPGFGLGDSMIGLPILAAVREFLPPHELDIYSPKPEAIRGLLHGTVVSNIFHSSSKTTQEICAEYDVFLMLHEIAAFYISPLAAVQCMELAERFQLAESRRQKFAVNLQMANVLNNQLAHHAALLGYNRNTLPLYSIGFDPRDIAPSLHIDASQFDVLAQYGLQPQTYMTVHDGWDAELTTPGTRATKAWLPQHWAEFVQLFKAAHPEIKIVQLGSPDIGADIPGVDVNLRGKTNISQVLAVIKQSRLHVDAESGLVHFARALHVRSVVLFGPTNVNFFGYARNVNLLSTCADCWWLAADWMIRCVRDLVIPECMQNHKPDRVLEAVGRALRMDTPATVTAEFGDDLPCLSGKIAIIENTTLATQHSEATHFSMSGQRNVYLPVSGMNFPQLAGDLYNLPAENGAFDTLVAQYIELPPHFEMQIREALRVLRAGGAAYLQLPDGASEQVQEILKIMNIPVSGGGKNLKLLRS